MSDDPADRTDRAASSASPRPAGRPSTWASLRITNYRYLWIGQAGHAAGIWMEQAARPFLILDLTGGSASHVGGVLAVRTLPQFVFGMWAGAVADSFDRRIVLLVDKLAALVLNAVFAVILLGGWIELWHLYAYALIRGTIMAFDQPARMGLVPSVVPETHVTNAVALMSVTQNTMRIVGAASGGILYAVFGATGAFSLIAAVYVVPVVATALMRVEPIERGVGRSASGIVSGVIEGLRYCFSHAAIRGVLLLSAIYFMFGMSFIQVFSPLFADKVFDIGSAGFAGMTSMMGLAALLAALFIARHQPDRLGAILPMLAAGFGATLIVFSLTSYMPGPAGIVIPFALLALLGALQSSYMALSRTTLLLTAPQEMRGRVIGVLTLDRVFMTAGAATAGFLSDAVGVQPAQIAFGLVCALGGVVIFIGAGEFRRARVGARSAPPSTALPFARTSEGHAVAVAPAVRHGPR